MSLPLPSRDSFNRFDNDLMPILLSYLPITQCFRFQRVNKRFKQNIFNQKTKLILDESIFRKENRLFIRQTKDINASQHINNDALNYVFTKCQNIYDLTIDMRLSINDETLNVIQNKCQRLKRLTIFIRGDKTTLECWRQLFDNGLQNIESLTLYGRTDNTKYLEIITSVVPLHKLKSLNTTVPYNTNDEIYDKCFEQHMQHLLSNIESVNRFKIRDNKFMRFANYFSHQIKSLDVQIYSKVSTHILEHLAHFANIECFRCGCGGSDQLCIQLLKKIGVECKKLKVLEISNLNAPFFEIFSDGFQSLEKLVVERSERIALLKNCVNLKHLKFERIMVVEKFFIGIHIYLPQLNSIDMKLLINSSGVDNASKLLRHFARLTHLYDLKISYKNNNLLILEKFIEKSSSIRRIGLYGELTANEENQIQEYITNKKRKIQLTRV